MLLVLYWTPGGEIRTAAAMEVENAASHSTEYLLITAEMIVIRK